jgi:uncharacterized protein YfaP (DUF2135 family)
MHMANFTKKLLSGQIPFPPPPPPKPKKNRALMGAIVAILVIALLIPVLFYSGIINLGGSGASPTPTAFPSLTNTPITTASPGTTPTVTPTQTPTSTPTPPRTISISTGQKTNSVSQTVNSTGGTIQVTDSSSPLKGLQISVPQAATADPVSFSISYSDVSTTTGLPEGSTVASKMISIETSGSTTFNTYKMFDKPVKVTLPYDSSVASDDTAPVRFYWYDSTTNKLDSAGFLSQDKIAHTITFMTGSFSDFVAVRTFLNITGAVLGADATVDTGFLPARDGWFIPNYGSYLDYSNPSSNYFNGTNGGMCLGMVSYAKWYYSNVATGLHSLYREGNQSEWRDDATAIQLAARAHLATLGIWSSMNTEEQDWALGNANEVALSWIAGMIVSGEPQLIGLRARQNDGQFRPGGHAILTYAYHDGVFELYDPNFPTTSPGNTMREIPFTYNQGFNQTYISGLTRNDTLAFNIFYHAGSKLASTPADYEGLRQAANTGFRGNSLFPTITLTDSSTSTSGTTPVDTDGDGIRDTTEAKVTISGTITGGAGTHQLNSTLIFVDNTKYTAQIVNGAFSKEIPMMAGANDVVVLATDDSTFYNWAGFLQDTIISTASPASMTVTLTWDQDQSDVDLHVQEPGTSSRHIYYSNKGYDYSYPYLDLDNTHGYGPEHYYATQSMTLPDQTNMYGTYQIRVEYYADHSGAEQIQPITWHLNVRYLSFKDISTGREFWTEESQSGVLSTSSSSSTGNFYNANSAWSDILTINYVAPNLADYGVPPPPQNVFS